MGKLRFWWELGTEDLWASFSCLQSSISLPYGGVVRICVLKIMRCPDLGVKKKKPDCFTVGVRQGEPGRCD